MNVMFRTLGLAVCLGIAGCSTMNSEFSCNATAGDSCLTIEQVDAMTRFADDANPQNRPRRNIKKMDAIRKPSPPYLSENHVEQPIWVAPWKDKSGKQHAAQTLLAGRTQNTAQG